MTIPLSILALLSLGGGYLPIMDWLEPVLGGEHTPHEFSLVAISVAFGAAGILLAYVMYVASPGIPDRLASSFKGLHTLIYNKYFVDEVYDAAIVRPTVAGSREVLWKVVDVGGIDGMVNGVARLARSMGDVLKLMQSGNIRSYATWVVCGSIVLIVTIGFMAVSR